MFKGMGDIFKQAKELQGKMEEFHQEMAKKEIEVETGGGMVKIVGNGANEILSVKVDDELINLQDREILEDLIMGAINELHRKIKETQQEEMSRMTGGIQIPGMFPK